VTIAPGQLTESRPSSRRSRADRRRASSKLLTTTDIAPQRVVPLRDVLLLQLLVITGIVAALVLGFQAWHGAAAGLAVAALCVIRFRGRTLLQWSALRITFYWQRRKRARDTTIAADLFDSEMNDGSQIGFRWDGETLLSLLKIDENPQAMTIMEPGMTVAGETVSVQLLADCLRQFDISLDSIDVISQGARSHGHSHIAAVYDAVLGPLPAIAQRSMWVAVRFDPSLCADAVRRRGGGREGILRTATTATRRVANRLIEAGLRPRVMTSSEIAQATHQLSDGVSIRNVDETWRACREGQFQLRSFAAKPAMLTTAGLGLLWTVPSYSTTVCISLRRGDSRDLVKIRCLARFDTTAPDRFDLPGLEDLRGQQFSALVSTLPLPHPVRPVEHWTFGTGDAPFGELALPASGCGQVIGADDHGRAVALPLFGPQIQRVQMCGTLHLAQQAVLRSLALGARVRVHTRRPAAWRDMVDQVGDQTLLWVSDFSRGSLQAGSERTYNVEMFDGVADHAVRVGVTTMVVQPLGAAPSPGADVVLELLDIDTDTVRVSTRAGSSVVTMVATDEELRYIKASFDAGT
jgi:type VII secretion protein EccE